MVSRLIWVLEHQNGSTAPNVGYSPVTPQTYANTAVESSPKMWYNFLDHIFDHNEQSLTISHPDLAKFGIALELGSRDRGFESRSPDQSRQFSVRKLAVLLHFFISSVVILTAQCLYSHSAVKALRDPPAHRVSLFCWFIVCSSRHIKMPPYFG